MSGKRKATIAMAALLLSPVASFLSAFIIARTDSSTEPTVGTTRCHGFPLWFYEQADGISVLAGWHPMRFVANSGVWMFILGTAILVIRSRFKKTQL